MALIAHSCRLALVAQALVCLVKKQLFLRRY